jgi:hypothetical protein
MKRGEVLLCFFSHESAAKSTDFGLRLIYPRDFRKSHIYLKFCRLSIYLDLLGLIITYECLVGFYIPIAEFLLNIEKYARTIYIYFIINISSMIYDIYYMENPYIK